MAPWSTGIPRYFIDLASHFVWPNLVLALFLVAAGKRWTRWLALAAIAVNVYALGASGYGAAPATASAPAPSPAGTVPALLVVSANAYVGNSSTDQLLAMVAERQPDVLVLQEVSPMWAQALARLPGYPYRKLVVREDAFGMALLSRHPLEHVTVVDEVPYGLPTIAATLRWNGTRVALRAVHPLPPVSPKAYAARNALLARNARALAASRLPSIMAGDFNATPWSAGWDVVQQAGLARATSLRPTWPAHSPIPALIPIDHIAASSHWVVRESRRGPNIGSDHFPVEAELVLRR